MLKTIVFIVIYFYLVNSALADTADQSRSKTIRLSTGEHVVITEGGYEPRSIGSYSLRVYSASNPRFPYDDFKAGVIRPRNGSLERLLVSDINLDGAEDIIVVIRSVGTGGYLSADAFQYKNTQLVPLISVEWLDKHADPVQALQDAARAARLNN